MSGRDPVQMLGNEITLSVRNSSGWNVVFDKTPTTVLIESHMHDIMTFLPQISKRDIHGPMKIGINKLNKLTAYPPRFSIFAHPSATHNSLTDPSSPQLVVQGLDIEDCCFEIITPCKQKMPKTFIYVFHQTIRGPLHCLPHYLLNHARVSQTTLNWSHVLL